MARIYLEYTKNTFLEYPDYFMFVIFLVTTFVLVSVRDVLVNIPKNDLSGTFNFFVVAFENTSLIFQVLIIGFVIRVVAGFSLAAYKNISSGKWFGAKMAGAELLKH